MGVNKTDISTTILSITATLVLWEVLTVVFNVPGFILPPPSAIFIEGVTRYHLYLYHSWITFYEMVAGFVLAAVVGVLLAVVIVYSRILRNMLYPQIVVLQIVPKVAIAPLLLIWAGYGITSKVLLALLVSFFPIVVNMVTGLVAIEEELLDLCRILQSGRWQEFSKVRLPNALPYLFSSLKVASTLSVIGAVIGEFVEEARVSAISSSSPIPSCGPRCPSSPCSASRSWAFCSTVSCCWRSACACHGRSGSRQRHRVGGVGWALRPLDRMPQTPNHRAQCPRALVSAWAKSLASTPHVPPPIRAILPTLRANLPTVRSSRCFARSLTAGDDVPRNGKVLGDFHQQEQHHAKNSKGNNSGKEELGVHAAVGHHEKIAEPRIPPTNSPTTAPTTAKVIDIFSPPKIAGRALGKRILKKVANAPKPMERAR